MTQAFIILVKVEETALDPRQGEHISATIRELHRSTNRAQSSICNIYQVKDPVKLDEWERNLKKENKL